MNRLKKIFKVIRFVNPQKARIVILDDMGSDILSKMVLKDFDYFILHSRCELFYITPKIIIRIIKELTKSAITFVSKKERISLMRIYLLSCLKYIKPAIVVTFIDNSELYQKISRDYLDAEFYFVTNGIRTSPVVIHKDVSMTNLMCWSINDISYFKKCGYNIDKYYSVGPLIAGYYKSEICSNNPIIEYDICIVSQYRKTIMNGSELPELKYSLTTLDNYLSKYFRKRHLSVCVATCSNDTETLIQEIQYFKDLYDDKLVTIIKQNKSELSTYLAMDRSEIIISVCSTAAYEAYSWGKKVLMCNFSADKYYDNLLLDQFSVKQGDYIEFEAKLDGLLQMNYDEYRCLIEENRKFITGFNYNMPAHIFIRNIIEQKLNKG